MSKDLRILSLLLTCVMFNTGQSTEEFKDDDWRCDGGCGTNNLLQELPFMISPEDFFSKFVHKHRPVLMRNVPTIWPALEGWSDNYFLKAYNKSTMVPVVEGLLDLHKPPSHLTIEEFFHRRLDDLTLVDKIDGHGQLLKDIIVPLCLRCEHVMKDFEVSYWLRNNTEQLCRSPLRAGAKEQLIAVVNGSLQVSFMSAKYSAELWSAEKPQEAFENPHLGLSGSSLPVITTELKDGDVLYIPQMWWRQLTLTGSPSLLVHFEWLSKQWKGDPSAHKTGEGVGDNLNRLSQLLRSYEESFSTSEPVDLQCPQQDRRMSEYVFETGKMDPEDYKRIHDGPDYRDGINELCAFDMNNNESPCRVKFCIEEPESERCILHTLDYCFKWDDRGCAEELPNLLNKMDGEMLRGKSPIE